ncbi:MAG: ORF6N domain-containing protein [Candidatus Riflebacteria bacterium]|nr:ORF6N domain-containing protein [Candidatus Riflebacteria bacterium]
MKDKEIILVDSIENNIYNFRGKNVMLDSDLARLYGVETKRLNEQVKRNIKRFPENFMFELTKEEEKEILKSQNATSSYGGRRSRIKAFTEHGALMLANVLKTDRAIEVSILVIEAFVKIRQMALTNEDLARRLTDLEKVSKSLGKETKELRNSIDTIMQTINGMMIQHPPKKQQIGFKTDNKN